MVVHRFFDRVACEHCSADIDVSASDAHDPLRFCSRDCEQRAAASDAFSEPEAA